jgi:NAD(P)-dependent dehydrogenase (short-subunit alcohol dehydrogenase family)
VKRGQWARVRERILARTRIALVTGGGTGIGRVAAERLASLGFVLVLTGRRREPLDETVAAIEAAGGSARAQPADIRDPAAIEGLFGEIARRHGRLDLLFNNAGTGARPVPLEDLPLSEWQRVVETNLTASFLCTQHAMRIMKAQDPMGGRIINNGSIAAHSPRPKGVAYTATKHAVTGLTRQTSLDGRAYRIACGQIDIGNAATEMASGIAKGTLQADGRVLPEPTMDLNAVADAIGMMAALPLDANVQFMTVMATNMPFIGRG